MAGINYITNLFLMGIVGYGGGMVHANKISAATLTAFASQSVFVALGFSGLASIYVSFRWLNKMIIKTIGRSCL